MLRKLLTVATLVLVTSAGLFAAGCSSDNNRSKDSYGLTGTSDTHRSSRNQISKGNYNPEWARTGGH